MAAPPRRRRTGSARTRTTSGRSATRSPPTRARRRSTRRWRLPTGRSRCSTRTASSSRASGALAAPLPARIARRHPPLPPRRCGYEVYVSLASPPEPKPAAEDDPSWQKEWKKGDLLPYKWVVYTALEDTVRAEDGRLGRWRSFYWPHFFHLAEIQRWQRSSHLSWCHDRD